MNNEYLSLIEREIKAIREIPATNPFNEAVELIHKYVHGKGGKLVISGMGKAGQIGYNISTTFSSTGTPSIFLHPAEAQHGDLGTIQKHDILFVISNSGKTIEILQLVSLAKNLVPDIPLITLTGHPENELGQLADISLSTGHPPEICPLGLTPTTSTTVMTIIGDILVVQMMKKINFSKEEYAKRHHSGYLGAESRKR